MTTLRVNLADRSYDVAVVTDDHGLGEFVRERCRSGRAILVTDENAAVHLPAVETALASGGLTTVRVVVPAGEPQKSLAGLAHLYDRFAEEKVDRRTAVVALGGGVIGDLAGFAAATFNRGLPLLMVPTTLLSMVDSSVGGKVGINHARGKNLIGAFHQPAGVWIDTAYLSTLPEREYRSGLAEVVKYGVILDADFFAWLEANVAAILARDPAAVRHLVLHSCRLKARVVEQDEREETGLRAILNYGHTFAHAFETVGGYGAWLHGEAVAAGMACAAELARAHGLIDWPVVERQRTLLTALGLPTAPLDWPVDDLLAVMRSDKKNLAGRLRFVLPRRLGEVALFDDVPEALVRTILMRRALP